jgi:hypothetical protein
VTQGLWPAVLRSGSLPFYTLFHGDHRPYYIDYSAKRLFIDHTHEIHKPASRSLRLLDPRDIAKYKDTLYKQLAYHKVIDKVADLQLHSQNKSWTESQEDLYQNLDYTITKPCYTQKRSWGRFEAGPFNGLLPSRRQFRLIVSGDWN